MEIEPWMLVLYMIGGICFFLFLSIKIMPRFASRKILTELKGETGKEVMRAIVTSALECMNEEIEIDGAPGTDGKPTKIKTTLGAMVMNQVATSVIYHLKQTFIGEKGLLSRELGNLQGEASLSAVPPQFAPYMGLLAPYMKKYPVISMLVSLFMGMNGGKPNNSGNPTSPFLSQGNESFRGV